jgi:hypothetical protein
MSTFRRTIFALCRAFWDAREAVGDHALFAALSGVTVVVLILVFATLGELLPALYSLAAIWLVFLVFVAIKFVRAFAHPDQHKDWEWLDYGVSEDLWRIDLRSFAPLRPRSAYYQEKPLLVRVITPNGRLFESSEPTEGTLARGDAYLRWYPQDFRCPKCGQPPPGIPAGEYEITWLKPLWGPIRRPLLRYTQQAARARASA